MRSFRTFRLTRPRIVGLSLVTVAALVAAITALPTQDSSAASAIARNGLATGADRAGLDPMGLSLLTAPRMTGTLAAAAEPTPITEPYAPSRCAEETGVYCYGTYPHLNRHYGLEEMHSRVGTGRGATIAVLLPHVNEHVQHDLNVFSDQYGLPRASVEKITMPGAKPPTDPSGEFAAIEGTVDLEMAHAVAPDARLIYVETGTPEDQSGEWLGSVMDAMQDLVKTRRVDVISMSYGMYEANAKESDGDYSAIKRLRKGLQAANRAGTTLVAATGNTGASGPTNAGTTVYPTPTTAWPAGDPLVTAVGGTRIHLDDAGAERKPDEVWTPDLRNGLGMQGATGGGVSKVFDRPSWQPRRISNGAGSMALKGRALPDVAMVGSPVSNVWFYSTYAITGRFAPGWFYVAGTSIAAPQIAGAVAVAAGRAGHPLGNINPRLHRAVRAIGPAAAGLGDLREPDQCNTANGVQGFCAGRGLDAVSGLGTVQSFTRFARVLSAA